MTLDDDHWSREPLEGTLLFPHCHQSIPMNLTETALHSSSCLPLSKRTDSSPPLTSHPRSTIPAPSRISHVSSSLFSQVSHYPPLRPRYLSSIVLDCPLPFSRNAKLFLSPSSSLLIVYSSVHFNAHLFCDHFNPHYRQSI